MIVVEYLPIVPTPSPPIPVDPNETEFNTYPIYIDAIEYNGTTHLHYNITEDKVPLLYEDWAVKVALESDYQTLSRSDSFEYSIINATNETL